jgi:hypothetical protein
VRAFHLQYALSMEVYMFMTSADNTKLNGRITQEGLAIFNMHAKHVTIDPLQIAIGFTHATCPPIHSPKLLHEIPPPLVVGED